MVAGNSGPPRLAGLKRASGTFFAVEALAIYANAQACIVDDVEDGMAALVAIAHDTKGLEIEPTLDRGVEYF